MASERHTEISRRLIREVLTRGDLELVDGLIASDFIGHFYPMEVRGPEGVKRQAATLRNAFPDLEVTVEHVFHSGPYDATRWVARGTHEGEFQGIPQTGKRAEWTGIGIHRYADGQMVEAWETKDQLGLLTQLGVIDSP